MYLVSNPADALPSPDPRNLTKAARMARTLAYPGASLMGRMLTKGHPEHDLPVEVIICPILTNQSITLLPSQDLAEKIQEAVQRIQTDTPAPGSFVTLSVGHGLMRSAAFIISTVIRAGHKFDEPEEQWLDIVAGNAVTSFLTFNAGEPRTSLISPSALPSAGVIPLVPAASCVLLVEAAVSADMPGWTADFGLRMMRDTMKLPAQEYFKVTRTVSLEYTLIYAST